MHMDWIYKWIKIGFMVLSSFFFVHSISTKTPLEDPFNMKYYKYCMSEVGHQHVKYALGCTDVRVTQLQTGEQTRDVVA